MAFEGKGDQIKGDIKQAAGEFTGNEKLENEGKAENLAGGAKEKLAGAGDAIKDKVNEVAAKVEDKKEEREGEHNA